MNVVALGSQQGVAHAATNDDLVCLAGQCFNHAELIRNLGAAEDDHVRVLRLLSYRGQNRQFLFYELACVSRQALSDVIHRCLRTVDNAKAIGNKSAVIGCQSNELVSELAALSLVLGGLTRVEADVFYQHHVTIVEAVGTLMSVFSGDVAG